ncbi:hypothetical protein BRN90_19990 [Xanthomonas oryzae pv. oryzae]|nr:hypothetical protein IXO725_09980 [Xanthomonas oryzae pv. oryzae]QBN92084.1 hypothetical protein EBA18_20960 [Xanthomonas oryzae pv. oryzae]QBO03757.1 hypothetical protein EBA21_21080 [Xanthomonas oryzae pv. oryzae]RBJ61923.1 hypothetical protein BRN90_19990 [Xanthomonas oryzae pv. oryzae]
MLKRKRAGDCVSQSGTSTSVARWLHWLQWNRWGNPDWLADTAHLQRAGQGRRLILPSCTSLSTAPFASSEPLSATVARSNALQATSTL